MIYIRRRKNSWVWHCCAFSSPSHLPSTLRSDQCCSPSFTRYRLDWCTFCIVWNREETQNLYIFHKNTKKQRLLNKNTNNTLFFPSTANKHLNLNIFRIIMPTRRIYESILKTGSTLLQKYGHKYCHQPKTSTTKTANSETHRNWSTLERAGLEADRIAQWNPR